MTHAITVRLNDRYETEKILLDRIDAIHEKTHQPKGRIVTEMLTSQSSRSAELSDKDVSRIAEKRLRSFWKSCGKSFQHIFPDMPPASLPPG